MKRLLAATTTLVLTISAVGFGIQAQGAGEEPPPAWAWGYKTTPEPGTKQVLPNLAPAAPAAAPAAAPDQTLYSIEGSKFKFTRAQVNNRHAPADWFPEDHPPMPDIVAKGRENANIYACGLCHMPNGKGRPENANVTGLSYEYIMQQLMDFKNDHRKTSDPRKSNTLLMEHFAKEMTYEEMDTAAKYFSQIPATKWTKVVESDTAPKTKAGGAGIFFPLEGAEAGTEPLGNRIVEIPVSQHSFDVLRHPRSDFTAYVPKGSVKKGEAIVRTGGGKTTACVICHGQDLRGLGPVPRLANRSPSYLTRQLYDMKHGNRTGAWSPLMAQVVSNLNNDDLLVISAYLASLDP